jgi:hypothetical protein
MARKKNRSHRPAKGREIAVVSQSAVGGLTSAPSVKSATLAAPSSAGKKPERARPESWAIGAARMLGSLPIAVFGLSVFAFVLMIGTMVESWYNGKIAQELVYRTWWFTLLLFILGINIFFAAVKKWPWKKHQAGFLITHLGLITMVSGGIFNSINGVDSQMSLVDTDQKTYQRYIGAPQSSSRALDKDDSLIRVTRLKGGKEEALAFPFRPGSLPWRSDDYLQKKVPLLLDTLDWLADPLPRGRSFDLGRGAELEVLAFYPHARQEKYSPADKDDRDVFPAMRFSLTSPYAGEIPDRWVAFSSGDQTASIGPAAKVEMLGRCPDKMLHEFLQPPSSAELGKRGQLVISMDGETRRFSVDSDEGGPVGSRGWKARLVRYTANLNGDNQELPEMPAVEFELTSPKGETSRWHALARFPGLMPPVDRKADLQETPDALIWYHFGDSRWGNSEVRGVLQFVIGPDDKLYYRSFNSHKGEFRFEKSGEATPGSNNDIWKGMNWQFRVNELLPRAALRDRYTPENYRPGQEMVPGVVPALRCRLTVGKESKEFWVGQTQTDSPSTEVTVAGETIQFGYCMHSFDLGFQLKLLRAEQRIDKGTQQAATFTSYVQLTDKKNGISGEDRMITMNQPLKHNGYKIFQSNYELLETCDPVTKKPVSYSGFTVSYDPGLWLKYVGSSMLALGIVCMFYMKAYFFKPRGRKAPAVTPAGGLPSA